MSAVSLTSRTTRAVSGAVLVAGLLCGVAACGDGTQSVQTEGVGTKSKGTQSRAPWQEPDSYTYTLQSSAGERTLLGTFRITVRDGAVAEAVGLDESARRIVKDIPDAVPTIGELLDELEQARRDDADRAEARYAADGHPVRISVDWMENAIDDEALYVISAYKPAN
ncbi:DUF6174 domain-containing protein [Streptomyces sp. HD]|uniref:DUF6174 domain-containing protein n=1 Tax=Streptomyces sp. HD TaxID=3020892 RepID=UPI00232CA3F9|nr:DUF6174 domain-containing protein [Streptomyces sp. HD]MDC0768536.1 DUF6174 domain-containing protein [Streptomyces sp. HD]